MGRWSTPSAEKVQAGLDAVSASEMAPVETEKKTKFVEESISPRNTMSPSSSVSSSVSNSGSIVRTENSVRDKKMRDLYEQLGEAERRDNIDDQNRILAEMEKLDSKHEKVFQVKAEFLQDDNDWEGAHKVLEDCVAAIPNSVHCLRRLSNIRSSTNDEKIRYASECLQVAKNDPLCMVDLAIALHSKGEFVKAKDYFERALSLPSGGEGYNREYILYQYGFTLESLSLYKKAKEAFTEACRLRMKAACEELKK
ncbi:Tetratricopeptide repeat protein [compost metagenome]